MATVCVATPWRIRRIRQSEARRRDKEEIVALRARVRQLEWSLWSWTSWWRGAAEEEVKERLDLAPRRQQQQQQPQQQRVSPIDYSRRDHLLAYSDLSREGEDIVGAGSGEEEDEDEEEDGDETHYEFEMHEFDDEYGMSDKGKRGLLKDEEGEEKRRDKKGEDEEEEKKEARRERKNVETGEDEVKIGNDYAINKAIILLKMEEAGCRVRRRVAEMEEEQGLRTALSELKRNHQQQIESYHQMATQLPDREYGKEGSEALLQLIEKWQNEAMQRLNAWMEDSRRRKGEGEGFVTQTLANHHPAHKKVAPFRFITQIFSQHPAHEMVHSSWLMMQSLSRPATHEMATCQQREECLFTLIGYGTPTLMRCSIRSPLDPLRATMTSVLALWLAGTGLLA